MRSQYFLAAKILNALQEYEEQQPDGPSSIDIVNDALVKSLEVFSEKLRLLAVGKFTDQWNLGYSDGIRDAVTQLNEEELR